MYYASSRSAMGRFFWGGAAVGQGYGITARAVTPPVYVSGWW
jgi:hypothetical protein